jgi:hypothetical protein
MPNPKPLSSDQQSAAIALRSEGLSFVRIAAKLSVSGPFVSESVVYKFLKQQSMPPPEPPVKLKVAIPEKPPTQSYEYHHVMSCPLRKLRDGLEVYPPAPTKAQMYAMLEEAWRNTARLSH